MRIGRSVSVGARARTGGKTIPENARLAHRFCNNSRSRIERDENGDVLIPIVTETDIDKNNEEHNTPKIKERGKIPIAEIDKWRYSFFEQFLAVCNQKTNLFIKVSPVGYQNWIWTGAGTSATAWTVESWKKFSRVSYGLFSPSGEVNKTRFEFLFSHKIGIEDSFGEPLEWHFKESNKQQSIRSNCYIGGIDDAMKWTAIQYDLAERLIKLENALRPYISDAHYKGNSDHQNTILNQNHSEWINTGGMKTLFGHRIPSQAADLDNILIDAKSPLSVQEIAAELKLKPSRVKSHLNHLQKDHKYRFEITEGKYRLILE